VFTLILGGFAGGDDPDGMTGITLTMANKQNFGLAAQAKHQEPVFIV
jgi:hypothetical protein